MTPEMLRKAMPFAGARAWIFIDPLNRAMLRWNINTPPRQAAFLGNVAAETASLSLLKEASDGARYEPPSDLARMLGNTEPGDGALFVGRGLLQVTGRANYAACGVALSLPLLTNPALLERPENAAEAAGWFWATHGCNELADQDPNHFGDICRKVNGGFNGINERIGCWVTARAALGVNP